VFEFVFRVIFIPVIYLAAGPLAGLLTILTGAQLVFFILLSIGNHVKMCVIKYSIESINLVQIQGNESMKD
jgi:hypothetical protein